MKKTGLLLSLLLIVAVSIVALTACFSFVTVTFGSNGGTVVEPQRIERGQTATEPDEPTREGFTFSHWVLSGESEAFDFSTPITGNTTLIAVWTPYSVDNPPEPPPEVGSVVVTFNSNGGTAVQSQTIDEDGTVTEPDEPTREGFTFSHWVQQGQTAAFDFSAAVTSSITLVAVWDRVYHRVTFDTGDEEPFYYADIAHGDFAAPPAVGPGDVDTIIDAPVAVVIVLNRRGGMAEIDPGMGGRTRMQIAREAALTAVDALRDIDYVGVVSFASSARLDVRITQLSTITNRAAVIRGINNIMASGSSYVTDGIRVAEQALQQFSGDVAKRHIILFADGEPTDSHLESYEPIIERLYQNGITFSAFGGELWTYMPERYVQRMAELGGGRYDVGCVTQLSSFMLDEVTFLHQGPRMTFSHWTLADAYGIPLDADMPFLFEDTPITAPITLAAV